MNIKIHFTWQSPIPGCIAVLIVTERRLFLTTTAKPKQLDQLNESSDDRDIIRNFPKGLQSILLSSINTVRMLEGDTLFRILSDSDKIVVPFGDGNSDNAIAHYHALVECLEGYEINSDSEASLMDNIQNPLICIITTAIIGGVLGYFLSQDEFDFSGHRSGFGRIIYNIAHSIGLTGISAIILIGFVIGAFWMFYRIKNPLKMLLANKIE